MSDRIIVMYKGNLVAEFDRSNATEESIMAAASNGLGKTIKGRNQ
jgi:ABC-type sugar transport system ATPase subunit